MADLREELCKALEWESAHVGFQKATAGLELEDLGRELENQPYTIWQLAEHIRFAQRDIIDFCQGTNYQEPNWPDDYWPESKAPSNFEKWEECRNEVQRDREEMIAMVEDSSFDLLKPFSHGDGQHLFRQALLVIDHEAYHTGEIVVVRKLMGIW